MVAAGRDLFGRWQCVKCHVVAGKLPNQEPANMAPDLAKVPQRLRAAWLDQWLADPGRIAPGTRMPSNFPTDPPENAYPEVLGGDQKKQIAGGALVSPDPGRSATRARPPPGRDRLVSRWLRPPQPPHRADHRAVETSRPVSNEDEGGSGDIEVAPGDLTYRYTLVVGPDGADRAFVEGVLIQSGVEVAASTEDDLAPDIVPPALVLLDDSGARADRMEAFRRLRHHPALRGVPVVLLAYDADIDSYSDAITKGAAAYLVKPVNADELRGGGPQDRGLDGRDRPYGEAAAPAPPAPHEGGHRDQVDEGATCPARSST